MLRFPDRRHGALDRPWILDQLTLFITGPNAHRRHVLCGRDVIAWWKVGTVGTVGNSVKLNQLRPGPPLRIAPAHVGSLSLPDPTAKADRDDTIPATVSFFPALGRVFINVGVVGF